MMTGIMLSHSPGMTQRSNTLRISKSIKLPDFYSIIYHLAEGIIIKLIARTEGEPVIKIGE